MTRPIPKKAMPPRPRRSFAGRRGFTLVELMVALLAGLIVSLGIVGLSKEATNTFHEELRAAASQMTLRVAMERIRADLSRVAFMSTGNIVADNINLQNGGRIAVCPSSASTIAPYSGAAKGLRSLAGIYYQQGGSSGGTPLSANPNGLSPDAISLAGSFTSSDDYVGHITCNAAPAGDAGACSPVVFVLSQDTVASYRLAAQTNPGQTLLAAFHPGDPTVTGNNFAGTQYMVRLADSSGHFQYALTCAGPNAVFYAPGSPPVAAINLDTTTAPLADASCGAKWDLTNCAPGNGKVRINPVEWVRWDIRPAASLSNAYNYGATVTADPNNYVLTRQYLDGLTDVVNFTPATNPTDPSTLEVVAEYAVDLKFAFSVDPTVPGTLTPPGSYPTASTLTYIPLDDALNRNQTQASDVAASPWPNAPQRIRSVRYRLATRTAFPDRSDNPPPTPPATYGGPYLYRYCMNPGGCNPNTVSWARVRTLISEVALANQSRLYY